MTTDNYSSYHLSRTPFILDLIVQPIKRSSMYHSCEVQARFCDTDKLGHINNTALAQWLEVGRVDMERCCLPGEADVLLRKLDIDFLAEVQFGPLTTVRTGLERLGNSSIVLHQEVWQEGICCVTATAVEVWFDPKSRLSASVPEKFRKAYTGILFGDKG